MQPWMMFIRVRDALAAAQKYQFENELKNNAIL
jgi:hypothetical protein